MEQERTLIERARRGDRRAYDELIRPHLAVMLGMAVRITGDRSRADDAVQRATLSAWRRLTTLRDEGRVLAWLSRITQNAALAEIRRDRRDVVRDDIDALVEGSGSTETSANYAARREEREETRRVFDLLYGVLAKHVPPRVAQIYCLREIDELEIDEVATELGIKHSTVVQQYSRAKRALEEEVVAPLMPPVRGDGAGRCLSKTEQHRIVELLSVAS